MLELSELDDYSKIRLLEQAKNGFTDNKNKILNEQFYDIAQHNIKNALKAQKNEADLTIQNDKDVMLAFQLINLCTQIMVKTCREKLLDIWISYTF